MGESEDGTPNAPPVPAAPALSDDEAKARAAADAAEAARIAQAAEAARLADITRAQAQARAAKAAAKAAARQARKEKFDQVMAKLHWRAYRWLPSLIPAPVQSGDREFHQQVDKEQNQKLRVPDGFGLRGPVIWGVELYGPLEIDSLYQSIEKLGWRRAGARETEADASEHMRQQRADSSAGWINLGFVLPKTSSKDLFETNYASLPAGVERLMVKVCFLTPSLTAVVIGFRLADARIERYAREINQDRATAFRPVRRGLSWFEPVHLKAEAVRGVRRELRAVVGDWFAQNLPGYFCEAMPGSHFPTMELLLTHGQLWGDENVKWEDWRRLVATTSILDTWTSDAPGLKLAYERHDDDSEGLHLIVALDEDHFPEKRLEHLGSRPAAYVWYGQEAWDGILVQSAIVEYLMNERRKLNVTRDRMKSARSGRKHFSRTILQIVDFFDESLGSSVVARELQERAKDEHWYRYYVPTFTATSGNGTTQFHLHDLLRKRAGHWSALFASEETMLRDRFEQLATILSARESHRAAAWTRWLTYVALGLSVLSLIATVFKRSEITSWIGL